MIVNTSAENIATLSANIAAPTEFKIRSTAKSFQILSSGLYSNKVRAVIRELSTNALDSHVAAGRSDVPFEVHLPTMMEPWFSVKDFGTGLDAEQVASIYTTYFESTKTGSNDFIGALGLGSKSPFSYTDNFTITAVKGGVCRIYSAFINDVGVPSIAEMMTELTDEPNGVEIKFSVTDRYDYDSFRYEASEVFMWFTNKPTITGINFEHKSPPYNEQNIVPGVHTLRDKSHSIALMGNIPYPLNKISEPEKHFGPLAKLLSCGLAIEFGIGEVDFAASREELSYVALTYSSINRKLIELNDNLAKHLAAKADLITCEWARAEFLYSESRSKLYAAAVVKYVADSKFPLYDANAYHGKKVFDIPVDELTAAGLEITATHYSGGRYKSKASTVFRTIASQQVSCVAIAVDSSAIFVTNDLTTGCTARARYHYTNHDTSSYATVYCVSHTSDDLAVRQAAYDTLFKQLHQPPVVKKASELTKRPVVKRDKLSTVGIMRLVEKSTGSYYRSNTRFVWEAYPTELSDKETYYYVCLNNYEAQDLHGKNFDAIELKKLMVKSGLPSLSQINLIGVRKSRINDIKDLPNWVWIEDKVKSEMLKVSDANIAAAVSTTLLTSFAARAYLSKDIATLLPPDSDYAKFFAAFGDQPSNTTDVESTSLLCSRYGKMIQVDDITAKINDAVALVTLKYPLIRYSINNAPKSMLAEYITMIDGLPTV